MSIQDVLRSGAPLLSWPLPTAVVLAAVLIGLGVAHGALQRLQVRAAWVWEWPPGTRQARGCGGVAQGSVGARAAG